MTNTLINDHDILFMGMTVYFATGKEEKNNLARSVQSDPEESKNASSHSVRSKHI